MVAGTNQRVYIKSTEFIPKNEYLLVKPEDFKKEETTESGLVVSIGSTRSSLDRPTSGTVVAVGRDIEDIKSGDFIMWPNTDGLNIEFDDGDFLLIRYKSVIGSKSK